MDNEGYPEDTELELIEKWDWNDTFGLIDYVKERWTYNDAVKEKWVKNDYGNLVMKLELHTVGWSGNESLVNALNRNLMFNLLHHKKWEAGGHWYYEINPKGFGYLLVSDYCKENHISRQYIHKNKDKFDWIKISHGKQLIKIKEKK
jgi:hypothetical protein